MCERGTDKAHCDTETVRQRPNLADYLDIAKYMGILDLDFFCTDALWTSWPSYYKVQRCKNTIMA